VLSNAQAQDVAWDSIMQRMSEAAAKLAEIDDHSDPTIWVVRLISAFFGARAEGVDALIEAGRASPDPWIRAITASTHVMLLENLGDLDGMRKEIDTAYDGLTEIGDRWGLSTILTARANVRSVDGDIDGAIADYQQALAYLTELGATEDDLLIQLRLAALALRRKDFAQARRYVEAARGGDAQRPTGLERTMLADVSLIMIGLVEEDLAAATDIARDLRRRAAALSGGNMMFAHMTALAGSACAFAAAAGGDLAQSRADLDRAYPGGLGSNDQPVLATVGVAVARYAEAIDCPADAAEILGAAATLRGHDDRDDMMVTLVRQRAVAVIGTSAFEASYAAGRALSKDAACKRLDPRSLDDEPADLLAAARGAARDQIPDGA
jgi:tetratricopeptide (TPR) repeat protein